MIFQIPYDTPSKKNSRVTDTRTGRTFPNKRFTEWHQAHRDATNALRCLNNGGVVVMHDCAPTSSECARRLEIYERPTGPWCGDVWIAFLKLRQELPYLTYVWNHDWGCGVIDTAKAPANLPEPLEDLDFYDLTFSDFLKHPERMNFVDAPIV